MNAFTCPIKGWKKLIKDYWGGNAQLALRQCLKGRALAIQRNERKKIKLYDRDEILIRRIIADDHD